MSPEKKQALPSPSKISMSPTAQPHWKTSPTCLCLAHFFFSLKGTEILHGVAPFWATPFHHFWPTEQPTEHVSKAKNYVAKSAKVKVNLKSEKINKQDSWKLKYPLKIDGWKMKCSFKMVLFRDMLLFAGGNERIFCCVITRSYLAQCQCFCDGWKSAFNQQKEQFHTYN